MFDIHFQRLSLTCLTLIALTACHSAQETSEYFEIEFAANLKNDQRDQWRGGKSLQWRPGLLTVPQGAAFWRELEPGPRLQFDLQIKFPDTDSATTEFAFPYKGSRAIVCRFVQKHDPVAEKSVAKVVFLDIDNGSKPAVETLLNESTLRDDESLSGRWQLRYRFGHLAISRNQRHVGSAYVQHHKSIAGVIYLQRVGKTSFSHYRILATKRDTTEYSEEQHRRFDSAADSMQAAQDSFERDDMIAAKRFATMARDGFREVLGDNDPYTLKAAAVLALALGHPTEQSSSDLGKSRQMLDRLLDRYHKVFGPRHPETADLWSRIGGNHLVNEDSVGALRCYQKACEIFLESEGPLSYRRGITLIQLGYAAGQSRQLDVAEKALVEAIAVLGKTGSPVVVADALSELGSLLMINHQMEEAKPHLQRALRIYQEHDPDGPAHVEATIRWGEWSMQQNRMADAESTFRKAFALESNRVGSDRGRALMIGGLIATTLAEQNKLDEALELQTAIAKLTENRFGKGSFMSARANQILAAVLQVRGENEKSIAVFRTVFDAELRNAMELLPVVSESEGIEFIQQVYRDRDAVLAAMRRMPNRDAEAAYEVVRRGRGVVSRFGDRIRAISIDDTDWNELSEHLRVACDDLAAMTLADVSAREISSLEQRKHRLQRLLQKRAAELGIAPIREDSPIVVPPNTALIEFLKSTLPENEGLVYDAFVIRTDESGDTKCVWVELGNAAPIEQAIEAWRETLLKSRGVTVIDRPDRLTMQNAAQKIRELIWEKIDPKLADVEHIVVVPDAATARVPWGALPDKDPDRVLLERFSFSHLTDSHQLARIGIKRKEHPADSALLVGGVNYDRSSAGTGSPRRNWPFLPGTAKEVRKVASLVPDNWLTTVMTGDEPTPGNVLEQISESDYVLLATHGFGDDRGWTETHAGQSAFRWNAPTVPIRKPESRSPLATSGLVLHPSTLNQDSVVTIDKLSGEMIAQRDLSGTRLVVLSACESGIGDDNGGEGVFGIQRAFEMAGVQTTVASLWNVPDDATTELMSRFFENHWKHKMGKLEALREAQLWLRSSGEKGPLPAYAWGAFVLSGDWN